MWAAGTAFSERHDTFVIRSETPGDIASVRDLNIAAFGKAAEADLVDRLRREGRFAPEMSLVVETTDGRIVGHALLSVITCVTDKGPIRTGAIAPGAIAEGHRGLAVSRPLMEAIIHQARTLDFDLLILLARPKVYGRLGFSAEVARKIESEYSSAGDAFMALELRPGVVSEAQFAKASYPAAFAACDG